jgi:atypical dual specificity phosphatase
LNIPSDKEVYESAGFSFLCLPIADGGAPRQEQADEVVRFVRLERAAGRPVAIHCEAGLGRTGTVLATYLIAEGDSAKGAIGRVRAVEKMAIETPQQFKFLEELEELTRRADI